MNRISRSFLPITSRRISVNHLGVRSFFTSAIILFTLRLRTYGREACLPSLSTVSSLRRSRYIGALHIATSAARWHIYELPHPNVGDYSPTIAVTAETGDAAAAMIAQPDFDFTKQVVLSTAIDTSLVSARNIQMSLIRGGLHVSGHSDATSLVVLPQQFSHCLRARDERVRLVRANLMVTGVIFSGDVDTDIVFDYGLFTPRCRWGDISDIKTLKMQIDARANPLSGAGLFPNWQETVMKLGAAVSAIK